MKGPMLPENLISNDGSTCLFLMSEMEILQDMSKVFCSVWNINCL